MRSYVYTSSTFHQKQVKHCGGGGGSLSEKIDFSEIHRRNNVVAAAASPQTRLKREKIGLAASRGT